MQIPVIPYPLSYPPNLIYAALEWEARMGRPSSSDGSIVTLGQGESAAGVPHRADEPGEPSS